MELWPEAAPQEHLNEMTSQVSEPERYGQFLIHTSDNDAVGLAEASIRSDYVNGTDSSPVGFLEGLYVIPKVRRQGIGRALVLAVAEWAKSKGCSELASDAPVENRRSRAVHRSLGFIETERVVYFNMRLGENEA